VEISQLAYMDYAFAVEVKGVRRVSYVRYSRRVSSEALMLAFLTAPGLTDLEGLENRLLVFSLWD
jgi:hypothetical protein